MAGEGGMHVGGGLGQPQSHGCTRVSATLQKWIYNTLPSGTTVINW